MKIGIIILFVLLFASVTLGYLIQREVEIKARIHDEVNIDKIPVQYLENVDREIWVEDNITIIGGKPTYKEVEWGVIDA